MTPQQNKFTPQPTTKKKLKARKGTDENDYLKILAYGIPGVGKTNAISGLLRHNLRVFVCSTDFGGSGLRTVKANLRDKVECLDNLFEYEFQSYSEFSQFLQDPSIIDIDDQDIYSFNPDFLVWEGMSNWQQNMLDDYVLDMEPGTKNSSKQRLEGLRAEQQDWDAIKRGTNRSLDTFLKLHNVKTGKSWHKYVTCHEGEAKQDNLTGELRRDPLIQGGARSSIGGAFDLVIQMVKTGSEDKTKYEYILSTPKAMTKSRGFKFKPREEGDMYKLWQEIQLQIKS